MVEHRQIKTKEGLTKEIKTGEGTKIPETFATVLIHSDEDLEVTSLPQSALTANCWLVQMRGFKACADCEEYLKPNCGGGFTLAMMIINHFTDSIYTKIQYNKFFEGEPYRDGTSFHEFVEWTKENGGFEYSFRKYKRHIKQLQIMADEPIAPDLDQLYPFLANYNSPNNKIVEQSGYHQHLQCECTKTTKKGSYRDVIISQFDETGVFLRRLCYYHQHCVYVEDKGLIYLNTAGHRTVTTKKRLNGYLQNRELWSERGIWFVGRRRWHWDPETGKGKYDYPEKVRFYDGMELVA